MIYDGTKEAPKALTNSPPAKADYYLKYSFFGGSVGAKQFVDAANKETPVVLHLHGCGGQNRWDQELREFYMKEMGFYFVYPDSGKSCINAPGGRYKYIVDPRNRLMQRLDEAKQAIRWLKASGFKHIVVTGHSEGGMVTQMNDEPVDKMVIHSIGCIFGAMYMKEHVNDALQLVSKNDPALAAFPGPGLSCKEVLRSDKFTVLISDVKDHGPLADKAWGAAIKKFLASVGQK